MPISRRSVLALASAAVLGTAATMTPALSSAAPTGSRATAATSTLASAHRGTSTSHVFGTWRNGTVRGTFQPVRSFTKKHETVLQGTLNAKVFRSGGKLVGKTTRHNVAIPIKAPGAQTGAAAQAQQAPAQAPAQQAQQTCQVLHLVLGPLNLNLLGLQVHLNRVVLNINAVSGAGNLLGNLLCAITHLLDNTSASLLNILQLSSVLNRILGLLGLG